MDHTAEEHGQDTVTRRGPAKTDTQMPAEGELYRSLIRKNSDGGRFLANMGERLSQYPKESGYILYSMYRQAIVEQVPIGKLSLLQSVQDPVILREYISCIQDGMDENALMQLLEENSGLPKIRNRRSQLFSPSGSGMIAGTPQHPAGSDAVNEMLQYNRKVLDYLAGDYAKLRDQVPRLHEQIIRLEQDLKHAKQQLYSLKIAPVMNVKGGRTDNIPVPAPPGRKRTGWLKGKNTKIPEQAKEATPVPERKEQLLSLLALDLQTEQLRFLTEIFKSDPGIPFEVIQAVAKKENSLEDMENYISYYMELNNTGKGGCDV